MHRARFLKSSTLLLNETGFPETGIDPEGLEEIELE